MTKVSAQTFARGHKKRVQLGKTFMDFLILLIEFILHSLTLKTMILTALAKFCFRHGHFYNTDAATGGVLKIQTKVSQSSRENSYAIVSF